MSREKKVLWYIDTWNNGCGIRDYETASPTKALEKAVKEHGADLTNVRRATKGDIEWVRAMGGAIPSFRKDKGQTGDACERR